MLKAVIFDLDGVVINSHPIHRRAWQRFLDSVGVSVNREDLEFVTQGGKREDILRHFLGPLTKEQVAEYGQRKEALFREEALEVEPVEGLPDFLDRLEAADVQVGLASCGSQVRIRYILGRLGWIRRFKVIVSGDDVIHGKPDPTIFRKAAIGLGVKPDRSVVIEDAIPGVQGAIAAGMKAIGVATNGGATALLAAGASRVVRDFRSLMVADLDELLDRPE